MSSGISQQQPTQQQPADQPAEIFSVPGDLKLNLPVPDVLPGTILDANQLPSYPGTNYFGYNILYASRSLSGEPIAVSGFVVAPSPTPPEGGWPLLAIAHGTRGLADECSILHLVPSFISKWSDYISAGYAIVLTDYEGLGTPGRHPYLVGDSEARSVLDSVRAVQNHNGELENIVISDQWVAVGNSQGGHSTAFVTEIWQDYAPELNLLGAVVGSPPQGNVLFELAIELDTNGLGYIPLIMAGYDAAYPSAGLSEQILSQDVLDRDPFLDEACSGDVLLAYANHSLNQMVKVDNAELLQITSSAIVDPGTKPHQVPVIMVHGQDDEVVPVFTSEILFESYCSFENPMPLIRNTYPGVGHDIIDPAITSEVLDWIADRYAGLAAPTGC